MYAVEGGHATVVKELCTAGADVSIKDRVRCKLSTRGRSGVCVCACAYVYVCVVFVNVFVCVSVCVCVCVCVYVRGKQGRACTVTKE